MHDDVHAFWFGDGGFRAEWFGEADGLDALIASRFSDRLEPSLARVPRSPRDRLDLIVLFDQFPRHIFRGRPESFGYDAHALALAEAAPLRDGPGPFTVYEAYFYMLPYEHAEDIAAQDTFVAFVRTLARVCDAGERGFAGRAVAIAERHRDIVRRFGRFPHRNGILGRPSSAEEIAFLATPGSRF